MIVGDVGGVIVVDVIVVCVVVITFVVVVRAVKFTTVGIERRFIHTIKLKEL